jgi:cation:H+ antiporter
LSAPLAIGAVILGFALLMFGGDALVRGAVGLAERLDLSPAVIGLTVVAFGTSMPELAVSASAALSGSPDIATGNIVGSNIMNVALVLGLTAVILPVGVGGTVLRAEWPFMFFASVLLVLVIRDGTLSGVEGAIFLALLIAFTAFMIWLSKRSPTPPPEAGDDEGAYAGPEVSQAKQIAKDVAWVVGGIAVLVGGGRLALVGAVSIAEAAGLSERVIGLTVVALGTSMPELVASVVAAFRKADAVALGAILGSNIYNILCILGITALITPIPINPGIFNLDVWMMLGTSLVIFPMMLIFRRIPRLGGLALVISVVVYTTVLVTGVGS